MAEIKRSASLPLLIPEVRERLLIAELMLPTLFRLRTLPLRFLPPESPPWPLDAEPPLLRRSLVGSPFIVLPRSTSVISPSFGGVEGSPLGVTDWSPDSSPP